MNGNAICWLARPSVDGHKTDTNEYKLLLGLSMISIAENLS